MHYHPIARPVRQQFVVVRLSCAREEMTVHEGVEPRLKTEDFDLMVPLVIWAG